MKKMKKLASLVLALTLTLGLCASTALAAEEAERPKIYTTIEWSWNVKNTIAKSAATPDVYLHYTDINGQNGTYRFDNPFYSNMVEKKGMVSFNSANAEYMSIPYCYVMPESIIKINNITFTARNNSPTFQAGNIQIKINYYYAKDNNKVPFANGSNKGSYTMITDDLVLFRTQTYTGTSDFVVKAKDKNRQMTLPNFKLQTQDLAEFPGGLPNNLTGSVFGEGSTMLLIAGGVVLVAAFHVVIISNRIKKEKARAAG